MTDPTDAARGDLGVRPENQPVGWTPPPPSMSHAEAVSRRDALISDPAFREKLLAGDVDSKQEWDRVIQSAPDSVEGLIDWAYSIVPELTEAHVAEIRNRQPVSSEIRRRAEQWFERHRRDATFVAEYFSENPEIMRQIFHYNTIMALPVRDQT
jgi:hypothetical protein